MEEKSRGISLRKKRTVRPKISAPKQISAPLPAGVPVGDAAKKLAPPAGLPDAPRPRERPQNGDKTADLVKRRYSTRFTTLPGDFNAGVPPMPSMPSVPSKYAQAPPSRDGRPTGQRIRIDVNALSDPSLRPEKYVASLLAEASEEDIQTFQQDLAKVKNRTSTDLQHNVFQNRIQFIRISKEAEKLKGEMRTLRNLMSELTNALGQATSTTSSSMDSLTSRKRANRSSVANLEALWNSHLQVLWKRVEGSQKYLPAIPGRHIVYESSRWVELNSATWKPRRRVHIIMLNDHLLLAADKRRVDGSMPDPREKLGKAPLSAIRCFPLQDVQIANLSTRAVPGSERGNAANAINLRVGPDSFTFATGSAETSEKTGLLTAWRKAVEDLRKTIEAESLERDKVHESVNYLATRDRSILKSPHLLETLNEQGGSKVEMLIDVDGKPQSIRWVEGQIDDLDIEIALQDFEASVERVEKLRRIAKNIKGNAIAQSIVTLKLNERASRLAGIITRYLKDQNQWKVATQRHVQWLFRLGFEDVAREAYLEARSETIKKRIRQCSYEGDLHLYVYQLSYIYFTIIKDTTNIYEAAFPVSMMSACVKWGKGHVDAFNTILLRQLSGLAPQSNEYRQCMDRAYLHARILEEAGLDFKDLIGVRTETGGEGSQAP
ncbi:hypothetical protein EJ06DRAFT_223931 [Trichodelitschia bisporula]|uniref:Exocyst complex component EXO84 n=1 Tax=Trichodelitschia bisporula TaxID=703511 RepID=A0A6G1HKL5_9PEZI|nr:hypothetical protein EJ06DRAFT_223931 [Trichodelitschia bisporula]